MVSIKTFKHLCIWVAFVENDWHEIRYVSFGLSQDSAERRAYNKLEKDEDW